MNKEIADLCPFRQGSSSRRLFMALARSDKPLTKAEVARKAHVLAEQTATLLAAYQNPMHKAPLDRVGVRLVRTRDGAYQLEKRKARPRARRPSRGAPKSEKNGPRGGRSHSQRR